MIVKVVDNFNKIVKDNKRKSRISIFSIVQAILGVLTIILLLLNKNIVCIVVIWLFVLMFSYLVKLSHSLTTDVCDTAQYKLHNLCSTYSIVTLKSLENKMFTFCFSDDIDSVDEELKISEDDVDIILMHAFGSEMAKLIYVDIDSDVSDFSKVNNMKLTINNEDVVLEID